MSTELEFYRLAVQITSLQMYLLTFTFRHDLQEKSATLSDKVNWLSTHIQTGLISDLVVIRRMVHELTAEFCELRNRQ
jgi:hypothetical protein